MELKIGEIMKVSPDLTGCDSWIEGSVIDIEHNPFKGLVLAIKDILTEFFSAKPNTSYQPNVRHCL